MRKEREKEVHCTRRGSFCVFEELRFGGSWITEKQNVDISSNSMLRFDFFSMNEREKKERENCPPKRAIAIAIFTSLCPKIEGAIELSKRRSNSGSAASARIYTRFDSSTQRLVRPRERAHCFPSRPSKARRYWPR